MHKDIYSGKGIEEAKENALKTLNFNENDVIFLECNEKKSLFSKKVEVEVVQKKDLINYIKEFLIRIINLMGIDDVNIEVKTRDDILVFNIISNKNEILIGRQGRSIDSLQNITNQVIKHELGEYYHFQIDVADYKYGKQKRLEKLAKYTAIDVSKNHCEIKLDPMNSYERRIIHTTLIDSKDVYTESVGEEPNRCVVIKEK